MIYKKPSIKKIALIVLALLFCLNIRAFAQNEAAIYLCELGKEFYLQGKIEDALSEFSKALLIEPGNSIAKEYINKIFAAPAPIKPEVVDALVVKSAVKPTITKPKLLREDAVNQAIANALEKPEQVINQDENQVKEVKTQGAYLYGYPDLMPKEDEVERGIKAGPLKITGATQASFGITPDDFIWKRANFDLNEKYKSWRLTSNAAFNNRFNTYDPRIYDSLSVNVDTENKAGVNFHTNVTVDPWSFTGKSNKTTVTGSGGANTSEVELYYWSNTGYVVNQTQRTSNGNSFSVPELKVEHESTKASSSSTYRTDIAAETFNIPAMKIYREFQPVRELWLDYDNDQIKLRAFPMAYQDQAYTSDDPLNISNRGIWWKDSKWLRKYTPGTFNATDTIPSFTKGKWDDSLSFLSKDSTGKYLTALRGFSFSFSPSEQTVFDTTTATPKHLWQDYGVVDNIISASRLKHHFADNFALGGTFTSRIGFRTDPQKLDSENFVGGLDLGYEVFDGLKTQAEVLTSKSFYDLKNSTYKTESRGNAYYFSFISRYPQKSLMDLKYGYDEIAMDKEETYLLKSKIYAVRMDSGFDSALSDFHNSRQDTAWSRHIHFRRPMEYYYAGLSKPANNWNDLNATRIGDGIDAGRNTLGFRLEGYLDDKIYNLFDVRNVHDVNGKFIENVARDELSVRVTDKLTAKVLGLYQKLPHTLGGTDPFVYDGNTGTFFINSAVADGNDPTIKTGSFGLNYDFYDWLSLNGVYERTNDYTLGYADFPHNILRNDTTLGATYYQNDNLYRYTNPFLYQQQYFPQAPYEFYNIFKAGLRVAPLDKMELYLDWTRNEFEAASLNSDNMNHVGLEFTYMPFAKFGMLFKYIYSRCQDIDRLTAGSTDPVGHHNFYSEFRYLPSKDDELILQYGEGNASAVGNMELDPYGGTMLTLDTQHIVRAYYRRKF